MLDERLFVDQLAHDETTAPPNVKEVIISSLSRGFASRTLIVSSEVSSSQLQVEFLVLPKLNCSKEEARTSIPWDLG